jgi:cell division protein ZapE
LTGAGAPAHPARPAGGRAATALIERYEAALARGGYAHDPAQQRAVAGLAALADALAEARPHDLWRRLRARLPWAPAADRPVRGLYLWGGVGRGKTWLMDLFHDALPFPDKQRSHFHRFMLGVHAELHRLRGEPDPLERVAARIAERTRVLCFDELFVSDITDAMILGMLFDALFRRRVTLVATSNSPPSRLYEGGLQRQRFLPAIALLEEHLEVVEVDGATDYRLRLLERAEIYHSPSDAAAERNLRRWFDEIAPEPGVANARITIAGRTLRTRAHADGVVWFDFDELCGGPRSHEDYLQIAREYQTVLLSRIPRLGGDADDAARRFIALIDVLYDHNVKLIASAAAPVDELYSGARLEAEYRRTRSRLQEMQSHAYLAQPHLP